MVVGHEGVKLQGVELEASVIDGLHILHGVFIHGQQGGGLEGDTNTHVVNQTHLIVLNVNRVATRGRNVICKHTK